MNRRQLLTTLTAPLIAGAAAAQAPRAEAGVVWHDVADWGIEGRGWSDTLRTYDRLPGRAQGLVRDAVWNLSRHSAGMVARFSTDARAVHVRYRLLSATLAMPHMPATGVSGVDLYAEDAAGHERWVAVSRPAAQTVDVRLADGLDLLPDGKARKFALYLPLYNGVESLEIGVPTGARLSPLAPRPRPLVFYGTSIMHGACASRPGMSITGILARRLGRPTLNLGFSGNGQMEPAVGKFLTELDPAAYVIDCLPNMTPAMVAERAAPLVRQLRAARPGTPIVLVEDRTFTQAAFFEGTRALHAQRRAALREAFSELRAAGARGLHYLAGEPLLGPDGEAATDGSHPNDLGMMRYADAYERVLRSL
jgi:lysophospholipase L1-like esterase